MDRRGTPPTLASSLWWLGLLCASLGLNGLLLGVLAGDLFLPAVPSAASARHHPAATLLLPRVSGLSHQARVYPTRVQTPPTRAIAAAWQRPLSPERVSTMMATEALVRGSAPSPVRETAYGLQPPSSPAPNPTSVPGLAHVGTIAQSTRDDADPARSLEQITIVQQWPRIPPVANAGCEPSGTTGTPSMP
ncbi:MAG: hypothetical protein U0031_11610 [Thermomicrobiales bacterium]